MARCDFVPVAEAIRDYDWSLVCFVYDYQTLIGGLFALGAAWLAVRPVWTQVKHSGVQTSIVLLETLKTLHADALEQWLVVRNALVETFEQIANSMTCAYEGLEVPLNVHAADQYENDLRRGLSKICAALVKSEGPDLDKLKENLIFSVKNLIENLYFIHFPASSTQSDQYQSYSDEQWTEFLVRGERASSGLRAHLTCAVNAYDLWSSAQQTHAATLRDRIAKLELLIAKDA